MKRVPPEIDQVRPSAQIFYGWAVVTGAFVVSLLGFGVAYTFASFLPPLQHTFAATRGDISFIFALSGFLYFCVGAVSGPLADHLGPRWVAVAGMLCISVGMFLASRAQVLWQVYVTYGLGIGLGVGFSYVPSLAAVQRWFVRRRGFASGMAVAGIGVGILIMPPLATWLISTVGWRAAYVILGVVTLLIGPAAALLLEHSPQRRGMLPDGDSHPSPSAPVTHGDVSRYDGDVPLVVGREERLGLSDLRRVLWSLLWWLRGSVTRIDSCLRRRASY